MTRMLDSVFLAVLVSFVASCGSSTPAPVTPAAPAVKEEPPEAAEEKKEEPKPPVAKVEDVVDEFWGVEVHDPYRYMENLDDPYVQKWFKEQGAYAAKVLQALPKRDELYARIQELEQGAPYRIFSISRRPDGALFYKKIAAGENVPKLYYRDAATKQEKLLVDPEAIKSDDGKHRAMGSYSPSPDGAHVVYGIAAGGSERTTYFVMDVATGKVAEDSIDRVETAYNRPQWNDNGKGFFYSRRRALPADAPATEIYKKTAVYYHALGTSAEKDKLIVEMGLSDKVPLGEADFPSMYMPAKSRYAVLKIKHGDSNPLTLYAAPKKRLLGKKVPWVKICDVADGVDDFTVYGDQIYLKTSHDAPRFAIVKTGLRRPNFAKAKVVLPQGEWVIDDLAATKRALYVGVNDRGVPKIIEIPYAKPVPKTLDLPGGSAGYLASASALLDSPYIVTSAWTHAGKLYEYQPKDGSFVDTGLRPQGKFDNVPGYTSKEVEVRSYDGAMVPLSIIYAENIKLDGSNPTLVIGYGSYGISLSPGFGPTRLAWLERGGVLAIAHVRGGGAKGEAWHLAGQKANKPNTWKDFIACVEYLISEGYTSKEHVAGEGGSAGGILIGRAITERPDLFKAAVIDVGALDAIRAETTTNGVPNIAEFGTVKDEKEFHALLEMSAYHHVKDGVKYPAVLLTHGMNDPRVDPWNSGKMAARLQAATASDQPILLRVDYDAGHGIGSGRDQMRAELADTYAFLFWQLGK